MNIAAILELLGLVLNLLDRNREDPETTQARAILAGLEAAVRAGDSAGAVAALGQLRTHVRAHVAATDSAIDAELAGRFPKEGK